MMGETMDEVIVDEVVDEITKVGWRIYFTNKGRIIYVDGEMMGHGVHSRDENEYIEFIDLDYGTLDLDRYRLVGVDTNTLKPILVEKPIIETDEQKRIRELEDELLLQVENEIGGLL